jgi:hypothetical protein
LSFRHTKLLSVSPSGPQAWAGKKFRSFQWL